MQTHFNRIVLAAVLAGGLSGCGEPEWVSAYEDCKNQMHEASERMKAKNESSTDENSQSRAMVDAMNNMAMAMGMAACESIKQMCEQNPDSDACQSIVKEYQKNKSKE